MRNKACKERYRKFLEHEQKQLESQKELPAKLVDPSPAPVLDAPDLQPAWLDRYNLESGEPEKATTQSAEVPLSEPTYRVRSKTSLDDLPNKGQKRPAEEEFPDDLSEYSPDDLPIPLPLPETGAPEEEPVTVPMEVDSLVDLSTMTDSSNGLTGPELLDPDVFHLSGVCLRTLKQKAKQLSFVVPS